MKTTEPFYAVQLPANLRQQPRLAIGAMSAGPALFYWRKQAVEFKRTLAREGFKSARVVRVRADYTWS